MKSIKKKVSEMCTSLFTRSNNNLVTDAAPLPDENNDGTEARRIQTDQPSISQPLSTMEISGPLQCFDPSTSLAQRNDSLMENGNSLAQNNTQQNVYQFNQINGLHIGSVFSYNVNTNVERQSDRRPKPGEPIKRTKSIDAMMKSDERVNPKIMHVISMHLGEGWRVVPRWLGFSDGQIDQMIEDHHIKGIQEVIYQLLLDYSRNNDDASLGHITTILWKNGFKECVFILKEHWKSGELATIMNDDSSSSSSCKMKDVE